MPATPVTTNYKSGLAAVITIGSNTYALGKSFKLPETKQDSLTVKHLSGISILDDGIADYGEFEFTIPEDGAARLTGTTTNVGVAMVDTRGATCTSCLIISDGGASGQRGSSADRRIVAKCLVAPTFVAPGA